MSGTDVTVEPPTKKTFGRSLILGLVLALLGAAGGFYGVQSDLLPIGNKYKSDESGAPPATAGNSVGTLPDLAFVPLEPLIVSMGQGSQMRHLRFRGELEVIPLHKAEVERLLPRVVDVLNTYLRALRIEDIEDSSGLMRLRAQMLRRVQIVTGADRINDLLIMEFVIN